MPGKASNNFEAVCVRGTLQAALQASPELQVRPPGTATAFVVLNGGFGNFEGSSLELLWSWLADLGTLTELGDPLLCTCANDFADAAGELRVMANVLGARFAVLPRENPFCFATTLLDQHAKPGDAKGWARGNALWYAVQGFEPRRRCVHHGETLTSEPKKRLICRRIAAEASPAAELVLSGPVVWTQAAEASPPSAESPIASTPTARAEQCSAMPASSSGSSSNGSGQESSDSSAQPAVSSQQSTASSSQQSADSSAQPAANSSDADPTHGEPEAVPPALQCGTGAARDSPVECLRHEETHCAATRSSTIRIYLRGAVLHRLFLMPLHACSP